MGEDGAPPSETASRAAPGVIWEHQIEVDDLEDALTTALAAGGTEAPWQPPDRDQARLRIVLDPAGHPLCLYLHGE